ncbi:MAG: hypothetical protein OXC63_09445 [Aestuariivita sp.]|nr:hypothetical protein [Aestuariivita sp.]
MTVKNLRLVTGLDISLQQTLGNGIPFYRRFKSPDQTTTLRHYFVPTLASRSKHAAWSRRKVRHTVAELTRKVIGQTFATKT